MKLLITLTILLGFLSTQVVSAKDISLIMSESIETNVDDSENLRKQDNHFEPIAFSLNPKLRKTFSHIKVTNHIPSIECLLAISLSFKNSIHSQAPPIS